MGVIGTAGAVVLYVRVSTAEQDLSAQRSELEAYAATRGWTVIGTYQERMSASGRVERIQYEQLLRDAAVPARGWDRVLVWALDRWSRERSFVRAIGSIERLESLGVRFHSFKEPALDSSEDGESSLARDLIRGILPTLAAFESRRRAERTQLAMDEIRSGRRPTRSGRPVGRPRRVTPDLERRILVERAKPYGGTNQPTPWAEVAIRVGLPAGTCKNVASARRRKPPA